MKGQNVAKEMIGSEEKAARKETGFKMSDLPAGKVLEMLRSKIASEANQDKEQIEAVGGTVNNPEIREVNQTAEHALDQNVESVETGLSGILEKAAEPGSDREMQENKDHLVQEAMMLVNDAEEILTQIKSLASMVEDIIATGGMVPKSLRKMLQSYEEGESLFGGLFETLKDKAAEIASAGITEEALKKQTEDLQDLSLQIKEMRESLYGELEGKLMALKNDAEKMAERGDFEFEGAVQRIEYLNEAFFESVDDLTRACGNVGKNDQPMKNVSTEKIVETKETITEMQPDTRLAASTVPDTDVGLTSEAVNTEEVDKGWNEEPAINGTVPDTMVPRKTLRGGFQPIVIEGGKGKTEIAELGPTGTLIGDAEEMGLEPKSHQIPELLKDVPYPSPDDRINTIGEDYLSPEEMRDFGEVPVGMTLPEVVREIKSSIPEELKNADRAELELRKEALKNLPYIESKNTQEVTNWRDAVSEGFKEVEVTDIVGSVSGAFTNWSTEYEMRSGRIVDVAQSLIKGNNFAVDRVFHINEAPHERIKLLRLSGPKGDIYIVKDGTHRVAGAKLAEVKQIPAEIENITEATKAKTLDLLRKFEWEKAIQNGLIDGEVTEEMVNGEKVYELKIKKQVLPWADLSLDNFVKMNQAYEIAHPGALDEIKSLNLGLVIPKSVLLDQNLFRKYLAGENDINIQETEGVSLRDAVEEDVEENERMKELKNAEEPLSLRELMESEGEEEPAVTAIVPEAGGESLRDVMDVENQKKEKERELMNLLKAFEGADEISDEDRNKIVAEGERLLDVYTDEYGKEERQKLAEKWVDRFVELLDAAKAKSTSPSVEAKSSRLVEGAIAAAGVAAVANAVETGLETLREGNPYRDIGNDGESWEELVFTDGFMREHWNALTGDEQNELLDLQVSITEQEDKLVQLQDAKNTMERAFRAEYGDQFEVNARAQKTLREKANQMAKIETLILRDKNAMERIKQVGKDRVNNKNKDARNAVDEYAEARIKEKAWENEEFPAKTSWWKEHPKLRTAAIGGGVVAGAGLFAGAWLASKLLKPLFHPFKTLEFLGNATEKFFGFLDRSIVKGDPIGAISDSVKSAEKFFGEKMRRSEEKSKGKGGKGVKYSTTE